MKEKKQKEIKIKKWLFSTLLFSIAFVVVGLATLISDTEIAVNTVHFLNSTGFLNVTAGYINKVMIAVNDT